MNQNVILMPIIIGVLFLVGCNYFALFFNQEVHQRTRSIGSYWEDIAPYKVEPKIEPQEEYFYSTNILTCEDQKILKTLSKQFDIKDKKFKL